MAEQRLIDANAIFPWYVEKFKGKIAPNEVRFSMNDIACNLLDIPIIEERKTGKWIHIGGDEWCCDQCGNVINTEGSWEHPLSDGRKMYHCNICGARMVREGEQQ